MLPSIIICYFGGTLISRIEESLKSTLDPALENPSFGADTDDDVGKDTGFCQGMCPSGFMPLIME
jgi:hypothetical protein